MLNTEIGRIVRRQMESTQASVRDKAVTVFAKELFMNGYDVSTYRQMD
ncbi:hypothetical protein DFQ00_101457 [Paenibacillus barcinonensis]|uniref:Uncharacterized protein n=1 Tax=Paenibacillus barcinonensis TaxID=198119 RepID=A0A2V4VQX2_PAEBA|nr:hypothetical protein DFQ00_101457 [Paenibacillus barcinonensis]